MACHYPDQAANEVLRAALVSMNFPDRLGIDADVSEYGIAYLRKTAKDDDTEALASMAKSVLQREFDVGATEIVWRKLPVINGFEENREHSHMLVLEYHTLPVHGAETATIGDQNDSESGSLQLSSSLIRRGGDRKFWVRKRM
jgi:hypothetical protein